jgi:protein SCO1/2
MIHVKGQERLSSPGFNRDLTETIARSRAGDTIRPASMMAKKGVWAFLLGISVARVAAATAPPSLVPDRSDVGVTEHLGARLPLDAAFVDHTGNYVTLADYFTGERPAVVIFGYHTCPMLCSLVQNATARALRDVGLRVGRDYDVVVISIDPEDTRHTATKRRDIVVATYTQGRPVADLETTARDQGFHYLTGKDDAIHRAADVAGFHYSYDPEYKQYAHPAVIMIASPEGKLARYLYGMEFDAKDIRYGLLEAKAGRSVSTLERVLLYCMHYDPGSGKYVFVAARVMQVGGALSFLLMGGLLVGLWLRESRARRGT